MASSRPKMPGPHEQSSPSSSKGPVFGLLSALLHDRARGLYVFFSIVLLCGLVVLRTLPAAGGHELLYSIALMTVVMLCPRPGMKARTQALEGEGPTIPLVSAVG